MKKKIVNKYVRLYQSDCLKVLKKMPDNYVDAIVTDPPYGLGTEPDAFEMLRSWVECRNYNSKSKRGFMGKSWDAFVPQPLLWKEALRVLKPGGHILCFAGTRTYDLMVLGLRIAGFEIRDCIMWVHGRGFPKSLNIGKAIDKTLGAERKIVGKHKVPGYNANVKQGQKKRSKTEFIERSKDAVTDEAKKYNGWGTALKPAVEPIVLARKPFSENTVAKNVLKHGTGGLNVDGCRVEYDSNVDDLVGKKYKTDKAGINTYVGLAGIEIETSALGRFPANLIHDGSEEVLALFPYTKSGKPSGKQNIQSTTFGQCRPGRELTGFGDAGSAARFFYCAKASKSDREAGLESLGTKEIAGKGNGLGRVCATCGEPVIKGCKCPDRTFVHLPRKNSHPTVKPTDLMRYLVRLVTPPNGIVLDPFMGSGSTGKACMLEGFRFVGIEREEDYFPICVSRIKHAHKQRVKRASKSTHLFKDD